MYIEYAYIYILIPFGAQFKDPPTWSANKAEGTTSTTSCCPFASIRTSIGQTSACQWQSAEESSKHCQNNSCSMDSGSIFSCALWITGAHFSEMNSQSKSTKDILAICSVSFHFAGVLRADLESRGPNDVSDWDHGHSSLPLSDSLSDRSMTHSRTVAMTG